MNINKKILFKVGFTVLWIFFYYRPEIQLDLNDTYVINGPLIKQGGRVTNYVIKIPNPNINKTIFDHDVSKFAWFMYGFDGFGANNQAFCKNDETLALLQNKTPVNVTFARNIGGLLEKPYMVSKVEYEYSGNAVECYSEKDIFTRYHNIWLSNFSFLSIFFVLLGMTVIWSPELGIFKKKSK